LPERQHEDLIQAPALHQNIDPNMRPTDQPNIPGPGDSAPEDVATPTSRIEDVQLSLDFIKLLKTASLDDSSLETDDLD
jgi:hypothetical protein